MLLSGGFYNRRSCYSFNLSSRQWTKLPDLPSDRYGHGSMSVNSSIFLVGGLYNKTIDEFENSTKSLKTVATMKESRYWFGSCVYESKLLLIAGGLYDNQQKSNNCFIYDTSSKTFNEFTSLNVKRFGHFLVNFNGVVYSIGGVNEKDEVINSIETYKEKDRRWKMCDLKLHVARAYHQAVVHKNCIYIVGGSRKDGRRTNTVERIDIVSGKIDLIDVKLRVARSEFASCKIKSKLFIIGGHTGMNSTNTVEILNLDTMQVQKGVNIPISDHGLSTCAV